MHHTTDSTDTTTEGEAVTVCCTVTRDGKACPEKSKKDPRCAIEEKAFDIVTGESSVGAPRKEEEVSSCILVARALNESAEVDDTERLDMDGGRDKLLTGCTLTTVLAATVELVLMLGGELLLAAPSVPDGLLASAM